MVAAHSAQNRCPSRAAHRVPICLHCHGLERCIASSRNTTKCLQVMYDGSPSLKVADNNRLLLFLWLYASSLLCLWAGTGVLNLCCDNVSLLASSSISSVDHLSTIYPSISVVLTCCHVFSSYGYIHDRIDKIWGHQLFIDIQAGMEMFILHVLTFSGMSELCTHLFIHSSS